ncbi:hypothetical protein YC2023_040831 [Brassica napus]
MSSLTPLIMCSPQPCSDSPSLDWICANLLGTRGFLHETRISSGSGHSLKTTICSYHRDSSPSVRLLGAVRIAMTGSSFSDVDLLRRGSSRRNNGHFWLYFTSADGGYGGGGPGYGGYGPGDGGVLIGGEAGFWVRWWFGSGGFDAGVIIGSGGGESMVAFDRQLNHRKVGFSSLPRMPGIPMLSPE